MYEFNSAIFAQSIEQCTRFRRSLAEPFIAQKNGLQRLIKNLKRDPKAAARFAHVHDLESFRECCALQSHVEQKPNSREQRRLLRSDIEAAMGPLYVDLLRRYPQLFRKPFYFMSEVDAKEVHENNPLLLFWDDGRTRKTHNDERIKSLLRLVETPELGLLAVPNARVLLETLALLPKLRSIVKLPLEAELRVQRACEKREAFETIGDLWPNLDVISVAQSDSSDDEVLQALFAQAQVEARGVMSTQGVVCIAFDERFPLAVESHFYEFECTQSKRLLTLDEVKEGQEYEVIISHACALRMRTNLFLRCDGHLIEAPTFVRSVKRTKPATNDSQKSKRSPSRGPRGPRFESMLFSTRAYA